MAIEDEMKDVQQLVVNQLGVANGLNNSLADGQVTETKILNGAVTAAKLGSDVNLGQVNTGAVTTAKIADDAVTTAKIADDAVTLSKLGTDIDLGQVNAGAVTTAKLTDGAVTPSKISSGGPSWGNGLLLIKGTGTAGGLEINSSVSGIGAAYVDFHSTSASNPDYDARILKDAHAFQIINKDGTPMVFFSGSGEEERLRISSSGNVNIGSSSDFVSSRLKVSGTKGDSSGTLTNQLVVIDEQAFNTTGNGGAISFAGNFYNGGQTVFGTIQGIKENNTDANFASAMTFDTRANGGNLTEKMRLNSDGTLMVGTTDPYPYDNVAASGISLDRVGLISSARLNGTAAAFNRIGSDGTIVQFSRSGVALGHISITQSATSYNTSSDYRLKENIVDISDSIERLKDLKPCNFAWKADGTRVDGFIAHEAQEVVPESVTGTKDAMRDEDYEVTPAVLDEEDNVVTEAISGTRSVPEYQGIDQSKLVPLLTAALQEAITKIEALEVRITNLEA